MAPFEKRIEIRWSDMDAFGHVNNAKYLTYLEEARDEFLTGVLGDETVERVVVRRVELDFTSSLTQDDDVAVVTVAVARVGRSSATTRETIAAASDGRTVARCETIVVYTDPARGAAEPFPDEARRRIEAAR